MARDLAQGNFEQITPEMLQELLGDDAAQSFMLLRDLEDSLERGGYLRESGDELTPRAIRKIGANALAEVYGALRKDRFGGHETDARGAAVPRPDETRPFEFGDPPGSRRRAHDDERHPARRDASRPPRAPICR